MFLLKKFFYHAVANFPGMPFNRGPDLRIWSIQRVEEELRSNIHLKFLEIKDDTLIEEWLVVNRIDDMWGGSMLTTLISYFLNVEIIIISKLRSIFFTERVCMSRQDLK